MKYKWKKLLLSITIKERQKKQLNKFIEERKVYEQMSDLELKSLYIHTKTKLEHKRNLTMTILITVAITVLIGGWKQSVGLLSNAVEAYLLTNSISVDELDVVISLTFVLLFALLFLIVVIINKLMYNLYVLARKLEIISDVINER